MKQRPHGHIRSARPASPPKRRPHGHVRPLPAQVPGHLTAAVCVICHLPFTEYGNNAEPVRHGRCCNACNDLYVIPARIARMRRST